VGKTRFGETKKTLCNDSCEAEELRRTTKSRKKERKKEKKGYKKSSMMSSSVN
jgi:hypothetical protein